MDVERELRDLIQNTLEPDEEILICFRVEYSMLWIHVVTNLKVISAKAIALRINVFSTRPKIEMPRISWIELSKLEHCELGRSQDYDLFTVQISGRDNQTLEANFTLETAAMKFHSLLNSTINRDKKNTPQPAIADRLRELTDLHTMNLISDEEFQDKRAQILKEL